MGGVFISPRAAKIYCAYATDGGTQGEDKACPIHGVRPSLQLASVQWRAQHDLAATDGECVPGCSINGHAPNYCHRGTTDSTCVWRADDLQGALSQHVTRVQGGFAGKYQHNEVVLQPEAIVHMLPSAIEGFFIQPGSSAADARTARDAHASFKRQYARADAPLLLYDATRTDAPFSLAS